jgi:hypothetical protein
MIDKMKIVFSELAIFELKDAADYYEMELIGLGNQFKKEVKKGILRIKDYPNAWPIEKGDIRRYILHKFPYKILYSIESDHILIVALAHQHQKPNYWVDRIL